VLAAPVTVPDADAAGSRRDAELPHDLIVGSSHSGLP